LTAAGAAPTVNAELPSGRGRDYFPALDGLRAVAFLMVFAYHYLSLPWGWAGVDVFFVLSGFLITGILFDMRDEPHRVRNFYLRRILRIFPLYYGVVLLLVLLFPIFRWDWSWRWLLWPAYLGNFVRGHSAYALRSPLQMLADAQPLSRRFPKVQLYLGHFWTLCVEEQFYLIWPCVVFWVRGRRRLMWVCLAFLVACPLLRQWGSHALPGFMLEQEVLYRWTPFRIDALLLGGLLALLRRGPWARVLPAAARIAFAAFAGTVLFWVALHPYARHGGIGYRYPAWEFTWSLSFIDLGAASILLMALEPRSIVARILSPRPLRWLGRISYGAYVFHDIFNLLIFRFVTAHTGHYRLPTAAIGLAVTLLLAWASYRWFEAPFLRLKDRWTRPASATGPPCADCAETVVSPLPGNRWAGLPG
jgi:peptidoglycan/LPS O-acetylase OafA/YrhL